MSNDASEDGWFGALLLDQIEKFLGRFIAYPSVHARVAHVLWIVHTHLMDCWDSTPSLPSSRRSVVREKRGPSKSPDCSCPTSAERQLHPRLFVQKNRR
jgi:hypothetical protein